MLLFVARNMKLSLLKFQDCFVTDTLLVSHQLCYCCLALSKKVSLPLGKKLKEKSIRQTCQGKKKQNFRLVRQNFDVQTHNVKVLTYGPYRSLCKINVV